MACPASPAVAPGPPDWLERDGDPVPALLLGPFWRAGAFGLSASGALRTPVLSLRRNPMECGAADQYIGDIENGGAVRARRREMKSLSSWSSENVLFTALIVAAVGWTAVSAASAASEQLSPRQASSCAVAHAAPAAAASGTLAAMPASERRCNV